MEFGLTPFMLEKSCPSMKGLDGHDSQVQVTPNMRELFLKTCGDFYKRPKDLSDEKLNHLLAKYHNQREELVKEIQSERPIDMILDLFKHLGFRDDSRRGIYEFAKEATVDIVEMKILHKNGPIDIQHTPFFSAIDKEQFIKKYSNFSSLLGLIDDTLKIYIEHDKRTISTIDKKIETIAALIKFRKTSST